MHKKLFKLALSLILVLGLMPSMAFAAPAKNAQANEGAQETPLTSATVQEPALKDNIETGTWGDCNWSWDHTTETITVKPEGSGETGAVRYAPWYWDRWSSGVPNGGVKHIIFQEVNGLKVKLPGNCEGLFSPFDPAGVPVSGVSSTIESITFEGADFSNVNKMKRLFFYCQALKSLDLSPLDTSNVTDMSSMFGYCKGLESINLSGLDTSNVSEMNLLFFDCESLTTLDVSSLNTSKVTSFQGMFGYCKKLQELDLTSFTTPLLTSVYAMFAVCSSLKSVNLSSFDTASLRSAYSMFSGCTSLQSLDLSNFVTSSLNDVEEMLSGCSSLQSLDLSSWDTSKLEYTDKMFEDCTSLEKVILGEKVTKLALLPAYEIKGHTDWYSSAASNWFTSQEINDNRLGTADTYTKEAPKKSIASTIIPNIANVTYTGSEIKPTLHITDGNYALQEGVDYTLSYENNINPGTATVKITGIGKYEGTISKTFTINPKSIAGVSVTGVENRIYTGSAHTQSLHITDGNYALQNGVDYTLSYKNNINPGTATITIKGIGKYTGTITRTFTISSAITPVKPLIVSEPKSKIKIKRGSSKPVSFSIKAEAVKGGKLSYQWYVNGKAIKGATKATFTIENPATIKPGHYALYCKVMEDIDGRKVSNKSQVSTLTVTRAVSLLQMKSNGKWFLDLKWNKVTNAEGYDVFFSQCNYGKKVFKCKKIATLNTKISYKVKDLEMNTCYKAYVRPFKMVNGKKIYLAKSPQVHAYTTGGKDDIANPIKLVLRQPGGMVRVSKTKQIQAKAYVKTRKKKFISTGHAPVLRYYSDDPTIATVSDTGLVTGVSKGTCKIYVVTQNGISQRYSVRVK